MAASSFTQVEAECAIGARLVPLKESWGDACCGDQRLERAYQYHSEQEHELYRSEIKPQSGKSFILIKVGPYFYNGLWVDPNDEYDLAILTQDYESALRIAEKRVALSPDDVEALFEKAYALSGLQSHHESIGCYEQILTKTPDDAYALHGKAVQLGLLGLSDEAEACHDKALAVDPDYLYANISKLHYLALKEDWNAYYDQLERIVQIEPRDAEERLTLAGFKKEKGIASLADIKAQREHFEGAQISPPAGPAAAN